MEKKTHDCNVCFQTFLSRNQLFQHIRFSHDEKSGLKSDVVSPPSVSLNVVAENDYYKVIVKPPGMATMGVKDKPEEETVVNSPSLIISTDFTPCSAPYRKAVAVHRLDRATGGLLLCSKSIEAEKSLRLSFRERLVHKRYRAIVAGKLDPKTICAEFPEYVSINTITFPLWSKESVTKYSIVEYTVHKKPDGSESVVTTVDLWPVTGRKHQLRRHMQLVGHAIVGDRRYSAAHTWPPRDYMYLWSLEINFPPPCGSSCSVEEVTCPQAEADPPIKRIKPEADPPIPHLEAEAAAYPMPPKPETELPISEDAQANVRSASSTPPSLVCVKIEEPMEYQLYRDEFGRCGV